MALFGGCGGIAVASVSAGALWAAPFWGYSDLPVVVTLLRVWILIGAGGAALFFYAAFQTLHSGRRSRRSPDPVGGLVREEKRIAARLEEIDARCAALRSVIAAAEKTRDRKASDITRTIAIQGLGLLEEYRRRYVAQEWRVGVIRWQNSIEPIADDWGAATLPELSERISRIEACQADGALLAQTLKGSEISDWSVGAPVAQEIAETQDALGQLFDALLARKARLALSGVSPSEQSLEGRRTEGTVLHSGAFSAGIAAQRLWAEFESLEDEYQRLKAEHSLNET